MTPIGYNANTLQKVRWKALDLYVCFPNIDTRREVDDATYYSMHRVIHLEGI